jgi:hypothetical protein
MRPRETEEGPASIAVAGWEGSEGGEATSNDDWIADSGSSGIVSVGARDCKSDASPSPSSVPSARAGNWDCRISSCCLTRSALRSPPSPSAAASTRIRRLIRRGTLRSRGISRSSRGGARSIAAKRDCSQRTNVSILWQESRNWSASARTRITKRFLSTN